MDDLGKQFKDYYKKVKRELDQFPVLAAQEAVNFFQDSFNRQSWIGETTIPWKKRKTDKTKKESGRAILVKSSRLKRSIRRMMASWSGIKVGTNVPYASAHNDGFKGTQHVSQYYRIASRKVATRYRKNNTASKGAFKRIRGAGHEVTAYSRKMNLPQRKFIGNSPYLFTRIERVFLKHLKHL